MMHIYDSALDVALEFIIKQIKSVKDRRGSYKRAMKSIQEKKTVSPSVLPGIEFILTRALDTVIDPAMLQYLIRGINQIYGDMPPPDENSLDLILFLCKYIQYYSLGHLYIMFMYLGTNYEYSFAKLEVFTDIRAMLDGPDALMKCGLEIISAVGFLINDIVQMESVEAANNSKDNSSDSIDSTTSESVAFVKQFCSSINSLCITKYPKLVLRSFECISRGTSI